MKNLAPIIAAIMASGLVAACRVGPNYHRPVIQSPTAYRDLSENPQVQAVAASYADLPWWQVFQDPQLQELIRIALKQNYDLQLATERINAGRAQVAITRSNLFPQVRGSGDFTGGKEHTFQTRSNFLTLTSDAAFQLDFFGKLRRATEASRAQLLATEDARQTVILTLVSDVASDYFALLQLDLQLQITRETVKTQEDSVKLTNLPHGLRRRLLRTQQRILWPNEFATRNLVLRRPSEPAHLHGGSSSRRSAASQVAESTGADRLPASDSACLRGRIRCADRLSEIPSGPGPPGRHRQGLAGIRSPVRNALQGRHHDLSRSPGWPTVPLFR